MKKQTLLAWGSLLYTSVTFAIDPPCPLPGRAPCGVEEVISCARLNYNTAAPSPIQTNEAFYNSQLFDSGNQDGFCKYKTIKGTYPQGVLAGSLQQTYYDQFCSAQTGTYFSYANFITAAKVLNQVTSQPAFGGQGGFACSTNGTSVAQNTALSTLELVNFFASEAQETTSALKKYTTDGLYFRYENGALVQTNPATDPATICPNVNCQTTYYPPVNTNQPDQPAPVQLGNFVAVSTYNSNPSLTMTYTPNLWYLQYPRDTTILVPPPAPPAPPTTPQAVTASLYYSQYQMANSPMTMSYPFVSIPLLANYAVTPSSSNSQVCKLSGVCNLVANSSSTDDAYNINDSGILYPGMYVGMGSLQLTGSSMYYYYGWYENNLATGAPVLFSNFDQFVGDPNGVTTLFQGFLRDGVVAFEGAFWYWMYRVIGVNTSTYPGLMYPSLHQLSMDTARPACHCVGAVTLMINGGCNDFDKRAKYATYFAGTDALNLDSSQENCIQEVVLAGTSTKVSINGAECGLVCPAGYTLEGATCTNGNPDQDVTPTLDTPTQNLLTYCQTPINPDYP